MLVERSFKTFSIPGVEKARLLISGKLGSKLGTEVFLSVKKVKNWLFKVSALSNGEVTQCSLTFKDVM